MAFQANSNHYIAFYSNVTGLGTSDFTIDVFTNSGSNVDEATLSSFAVQEVDLGYYYAQYIPSAPGFYFIGFSNTLHSINVADAANVEPAMEIVNLTQDTSGMNALKPNLPLTHMRISPPLSEYILMVFQSDDWQVGRTDNTYATAMTRLDHAGNWITTPLVVSPGKYHLIIRNNYGTTHVFKTFLEV